MGLVVYYVARAGEWSAHAKFLRDLSIYAFTVVFGATVYVAASSLFRAPELDELGSAMAFRRSRRK
jgi:hypothetical protein